MLYQIHESNLFISLNWTARTNVGFQHIPYSCNLADATFLNNNRGLKSHTRRSRIKMDTESLPVGSTWRPKANIATSNIPLVVY